MTLKELLKETSPVETDPNWWKVRCMVLATDRNKEVSPPLLEVRINLRRN